MNITDFINHFNWIRPLHQNKIQLTLFRAVIAWNVPDYNKPLQYERSNNLQTGKNI